MASYNKILVGETGINNQGSNFIVEEYIDRKNVIIKFLDKYEHKQTIASWDVRRGASYNPFHPITYGVGYCGIGVAKRNNSVESDRWLRMLDRCYSNKYPSYAGCLVDEKWHNFQTFYKWMNGKYEHYQEEKVAFNLDKEILSKNIPGKLYSSETCCIVPESINLLITSDLNLKTPGLSFRDNKIWVYISEDGKRKHLGVFSLKEQFKAQKTYYNAKAEIINNKAEKYKHLLTAEVYSKLNKITQQLKENYE